MFCKLNYRKVASTNASSFVPRLIYNHTQYINFLNCKARLDYMQHFLCIYMLLHLIQIRNNLFNVSTQNQNLLFRTQIMFWHFHTKTTLRKSQIAELIVVLS